MICWASLVAQMVKNLPEMQETWIRSLGQEDLLEKEIPTHSQYSCLRIPMDRGAWWTIVHGVAKSWTHLSNLALTVPMHTYGQLIYDKGSRNIQ